MNAEKIANKARKSISKYCIDECHAYCCRKGYLVATPKEYRKITRMIAIGVDKTSFSKILTVSVLLQIFEIPNILPSVKSKQRLVTFS